MTSIFRALRGWPDSPKIKESFPHPVESGVANLIASPQKWYLEFTLFGPDRRYNSTIVQWESSSLKRKGELCEKGWDRFKTLKSDKRTKNSSIESDVGESISVYLNYASQKGVTLCFHQLFHDEKSHNSFQKAMQWCEVKGPEMVNFCREMKS